MGAEVGIGMRTTGSGGVQQVWIGTKSATGVDVNENEETAESK